MKKLGEILEQVAKVAEALVPLIPGANTAATIIEVSAGLTSKIIEAFAREGVQTTDDAGNIISREEAAIRIQAQFDVALMGLGRIKERGQAELDKPRE